MNWGTKIVIALALFIILIASFGIYMVTQDSDSLIYEDYYERGLNYDRLHPADSAEQLRDSVQPAPKME